MSGQDRKRGYDTSEPSTSSGYRKKPYDRDSESVSKNTKTETDASSETLSLK